MLNKIKNLNFFYIFTKFLIIILPFYVIIKVYFDKKLGLPIIGFFIKEFIVFLLFIFLLREYKQNKFKFKFDKIDYFILAFIIYGIIISLINNLGLKEIIIGGRFDFLGFIVFEIFKHGKVLLKNKKNELIKTFLTSASISLILGLIFKFVLKEEFLEIFGFSKYVSDFNFKGGIPIYQGVEASGIRRFQGILDSPLSMGYFLIIFIFLYSYINRKKFDYAFFLGLIILIILVFLTYSRAAMLGVIFGYFTLLLLNIKKIFYKYKRFFLLGLITTIIIVIGIGYIFQDKIHNVFLRDSSTSGHFSRMKTGIERFVEKPFGSGLTKAGPGYRYFVKQITKKTDDYYIPESRFIQILIEGGIVFFIIYLLIIYNISHNLLKQKNYYIFFMFTGVLIMGLFLHIFEYTYLTIILYIFLGIFYKKI